MQRKRSARRRLAPDRNVAVVSHSEYVPIVTAVSAWCVNVAVNKAAWGSWPLTFWPWKWCPSHVWRGRATAVAILVFYKHLCSRLIGPMYATDRQTSDRRQTASSLLGAGIIRKYVQLRCKRLRQLIPLSIIVNYGVGHKIVTIALSRSCKNFIKKSWTVIVIQICKNQMICYEWEFHLSENFCPLDALHSAVFAVVWCSSVRHTPVLCLNG